jgi:hypothetical protein
MPAVKLHKGLVVAFVGVMDDRHALLADGIPNAVDACDEDKPAASATYVTEGSLLPQAGNPDSDRSGHTFPKSGASPMFAHNLDRGKPADVGSRV